MNSYYNKISDAVCNAVHLHERFGVKASPILIKKVKKLHYEQITKEECLEIEETYREYLIKFIRLNSELFSKYKKILDSIPISEIEEEKIKNMSQKEEKKMRENIEDAVKFVEWINIFYPIKIPCLISEKLKRKDFFQLTMKEYLAIKAIYHLYEARQTMFFSGEVSEMFEQLSDLFKNTSGKK